MCLLNEFRVEDCKKKREVNEEKESAVAWSYTLYCPLCILNLFNILLFIALRMS